MLAEIYPLQVLLMTFSAMLNRDQCDVQCSERLGRLLKHSRKSVHRHRVVHGAILG